MKKEKHKYEPKDENPLADDPTEYDVSSEDVKDANSIEDFIELKSSKTGSSER